MLSCAFGARSGAIGCRLAARGQLRKLEGLGKDGWASGPGAESRSRRCRCRCGCKCSTRPTLESSKQARTRHAGGLATSLADLAQCYQSALRTIQASIRGSVGQHGNFVTPAQGKMFGEGQFVPRSSGCARAGSSIAALDWDQAIWGVFAGSGRLERAKLAGELG